MNTKLRVNIQYSIDFDDIPKEVVKLVSETKDELSLGVLIPITDLIKSIEDEKNIHNILDLIDNLREKLSKIDYRLLDCASILGGYQKTLANLPNMSEVEDIENIEEKNDES